MNKLIVIGMVLTTIGVAMMTAIQMVLLVSKHCT
jgi:hypothetical protein